MAFCVAGCGSLLGGSSEDDFTIEQGELATYALPNTRRVSHAPDSSVHLQIVEKDGKLDFQLDGSYRKMLVEWSAGAQGSRSYFNTHATLWSKELSLASLIPERGVQTLSKDLALDMVDERLAEYDSTLQIDVYIFAPSLRRLDLGDLQLDGAGRRVELRDQDGTEYRPILIESSAPLEAFRAGRRTLYGRNAVIFQRYAEDGSDLLESTELRLYVRPGRLYFTWTFPGNRAPSAASAPDAR